MGDRRILDPVDRFGEVLFGLIMVLTFTCTLSVAESGREDIRLMLVAAVGCNVAWGLVDAVMYVIIVLVRRAREAADTGGAIDPRPRAHLVPRDFLEAAGVFVVVVLASFPVALPFLFMQDALRALRVSNLIALVMLFFGGWQLAKYAGLSRWRLGTGMLAVGTVLVLATIALGG
jgi:hypothetical protein